MMDIKLYGQVELIPHTANLNRVANWVGIGKLKYVLSMWERTERYYHNIQHLTEMLEQYSKADLSKFNELEKDALLCAIVYHDAVYDPRAEHPQNEIKSRELWELHLASCTDSHLIQATRISHGFEEPKDGLKKAVSALIDATQNHTKVPSSELEKLFIRWDLWSLASDDLTVLIDAERRVLKEYQFHDYEDYRIGRIGILESFKKTIYEINPDSKIESLIQYVKARKLRIGIYAGSFYPMHTGHYSIIKRAEKVFDKIIIATGKNPLKSADPKRGEYTLRLIQEILPYHQIESFGDDLLTNYVQSKRTEYVEPTVIKGLGRSGDYEDEKMQMRYMEDMDPTINMAFFISDRRFDYVSSTGARIVEAINPDTYSKYALGNWPDAEEKLKS